MENKKIHGFIYENRKINAFDIIGFTKIVKSGGELHDEIRSDGRWDILKNMNSKNKEIYGIASQDKECPIKCKENCKSCYRYTMGIADDENFIANLEYDDLFKFYVKESDWIVFKLDAENGYGELWGKDPYKMITELGYNYNWDLAIHIDVFYENNKIEFWMPVK